MATGLLLASSLFAQRSVLEKGDKYFDKFDFDRAMEYYMDAFDANPNNEQATRRIADCYRRSGNVAESAEWYKQTLDLEGSIPSDMLYYAEALKELGNYAESVFWYAQYSGEVPTDTRAQRHIKNDKYFHELTADSLKYTLKKLEINNENPAFGVSKFGDQYIFSATATGEMASEENVWDKLPYLDVFVCDKDIDNEFINPRPLAGEINSKYHDGPAVYDAISGSIFVTRNNMKNGKVVLDENGTANLQIYEALPVGEGWNELIDLPFNHIDYSCGHAAINNTGSRLYFVSNMDGGIGGTDLYYTDRVGDGWSEPVNLGPEVNTEGNEMFPYLSDQDKLYFSSDGHAGLGGLDVFMTEFVSNKWTTPINIGFPINSNKDDFSMMYEETHQSGYFSSNRDGKGRDNIYYFSTIDFMEAIFAATIACTDPTKTLAGMPVTIKNVTTGELEEVILDEYGNAQTKVKGGDEIEVYLGGKELAHGEPILTHTVENPLIDTYNEGGTVFVSPEEARALGYDPKDLPHDVHIVGTTVPVSDVLVSDKNAQEPELDLLDQLDEFTDENWMAPMTRKNAQTFVMERTEDGKMVMKGLEVEEQAPEEFISEGLREKLAENSLSQRQSEPISQISEEKTLGAIETGENKAENALDEKALDDLRNLIHSEVTGNYHNLSEEESARLAKILAPKLKETENVKKSLLDNLMSLQEDLSSLDPIEIAGLQNEPEKDNSNLVALTETAQKLNTELAQQGLENVYFDFDKSNIRQDAISTMEKVLDMMQNNEALVLHVSAHTDSRGSNAYNDALSSRRANSVQAYLEAKGISSDRFVIDYHGEHQLVNKCGNGVACSEDDHQLNRRAELTFITGDTAASLK